MSRADFGVASRSTYGEGRGEEKGEQGSVTWLKRALGEGGKTAAADAIRLTGEGKQ